MRNPLFLSVIAAVLLYSCAQVVSPNGGAKDTTPPKALKYSPDSGAVNFNSKSVIISFNEYIQLGDLNSQLIISPPMEKAPEIKVKNKDLIINFRDSLKKNTTYTINFGTALQDITENNAAENFQYVFSTGSYLDSLSLSGRVMEAFDGKTDKGVLVMLYRDMGDSVPMKKLPDYFGKTKGDGTYKINNIRAGSYKAFALKDANADYRYNVQEELIAFADRPIDIQKSTTLDFKLFKEIPSKQFLKKSSAVDYGHLLFVFNRPVDKLEINPIGFMSKKEWKLEEWNEVKDTMHLWLIDVGVESLKLELKDNGKVIDTADIRLIKREAAEKATRGKMALVNTSATSFERNTESFETIPLVFNRPLKNAPAKLEKEQFILKDSLSKKLAYVDMVQEAPRRYKLYLVSIDTVYIEKNKALVKTPVKLNGFKTPGNYSVYIKPKTFSDIYDFASDSIKLEIKVLEDKAYGTLKLKISNPRANTLIQLLREDGSIAYQEYNIDKKGTLEHTHLIPGKYKARMIYDNNGNGKWDTGNYLRKEQPEKIVYYSGIITVRSNWDLELDWNISD